MALFTPGRRWQPPFFPFKKEPFGKRVLRKTEQIIREEMNRAGAQEVTLPFVQPAEIWQKSGRWNVYGKELMRLKDRNNRDFCLGPTHEEVVTELVKNEVTSYRQLPLNLYQIHIKFRDERRPRFGIMRAREPVTWAMGVRSPR